MEHHLNYPHSQTARMEIVLHKVLDIVIPVFLMTGALPLLKKFLVWLLMTLYEIFITHEHLF